MKMLVFWFVFCGFLGIAVGLVYMQIPMDVLLNWGMGAVYLVWLVALVTLPWNLHFQAKHLLFEMQRSRELGISVNPEREAYTAAVRDRMLRVSIVAHLFSAVLIAIVTWVTSGTLGYYFAVFYLLGTFVRPGFEYYGYLKRRLGQMLDEVKYPREDVVELRAKVLTLTDRADTAETRLDKVDRRLDEQAERCASDLRHLDATCKSRDAELDRKLGAVLRKFEDTAGSLTDNQEILAGLRAFLRLVREGDAGR